MQFLSAFPTYIYGTCSNYKIYFKNFEPLILSHDILPFFLVWSFLVANSVLSGYCFHVVVKMMPSTEGQV